MSFLSSGFDQFVNGSIATMCVLSVLCIICCAGMITAIVCCIKEKKSKQQNNEQIVSVQTGQPHGIENV